MEDQSHPFYLHPSDSPGLQLVSQPLTEDNFPSWHRALTMALIAKNKIGFVDGTIEPVPDTDPQYQLWLRNNNIVSSWLLNSVSKEITASVIHSSTAAEFWKDLHDRFQQRNGPRVFQLKHNLVNCTQGSLTVNQYFTKLKGIWDELSEYRPNNRCICSGNQEILQYIQNEYVLTFLMGLNESFCHIRGQILLTDPLPPISHVYSLMIQEEKQREVGGSNGTVDSQLAFAVQTSQKSAKKDKDRPLCSHCGILGHVKEKCFKLHGYPPGYKKGKGFQGSNRVNQVADEQFSAAPDSVPNHQQYQQMITFLQTQMARAAMQETNQMDNASIGSIICVNKDDKDEGISVCSNARDV